MAGAVLAGGLVLAGCSAADPATTETGATSDATITAALSGDPTTLDSGISSNALTIYVAQNIFEQLFALDADFVVRPMLADSYELSEDLLTYTITLRSGVTFQDGQPMTSADVQASIERWFEVSSNGITTKANVESIETPDDSTIVFNLNKPTYSFLGQLAQQVQAAIILPASIIEEAGTEPLTTEQTIGTGPYQLGTYTPGQNIVLEKFEDYSSRTEEWGGFAGAKHAYANSIDYKFVPDASQRLSGLQTGQWAWVDALGADDATAARENPDFTTKKAATGLVSTLLLNHNSASVFADQDARLALNLLVDKESIAAATLGAEDNWAPLTPAMVISDNKAMFSSVGEDVFNSYDPDEAKELFEDAGVDASTPIRILTTQTYPSMYGESVILQQEFEEIGLTAELEVYDFPTMIEKLSTEPTSWDISMTFFDGGVTAPSQVLWLGPSWPGEYSDPEMTELVASFEESTTPGEALAVVDEIQEKIYETMPVVQMGAVQGTGVYSAKLDLPGNFLTVLWNASYSG